MYGDSNSNSSPETENYEANISPIAVRLDLEEGTNYDEDSNASSQHSRRRNIVTILSLLPLIGALIALGILMTKQTSSSSSDTSTAIDNGSSSYVMSSNVTDTVSVWDTTNSEVETISFTSSGVKQKEEDILDSTVLTVDIDEMSTSNIQPTGSPSNEVRFGCLFCSTHDMHMI